MIGVGQVMAIIMAAALPTNLAWAATQGAIAFIAGSSASTASARNGDDQSNHQKCALHLRHHLRYRSASSSTQILLRSDRQSWVEPRVLFAVTVPQSEMSVVFEAMIGTSASFTTLQDIHSEEDTKLPSFMRQVT